MNSHTAALLRAQPMIHALGSPKLDHSNAMIRAPWITEAGSRQRHASNDWLLMILILLPISVMFLAKMVNEYAVAARHRHISGWLPGYGPGDTTRHIPFTHRAQCRQWRDQMPRLQYCSRKLPRY